MVEWTEENVSLLKKLWEEGQPASKISSQIPDSTRNAVIGKARRLGLPKHKRAGGQKQPRNRRRKEGIQRAMPMLRKVEVVEFHPPDGPGIPFLQVTDKTCRSIVGRGDDGLVLFCSNRSSEGLPYCPYHASIYYNYSPQKRG